MKRFEMPAWRKQVQDRIVKRQNALVAKYQAEMDKALRQAARHVADSAIRTHTFRKPNLDPLYPISEAFYRAVLHGAFIANKENEQAAKGKKRLARLPLGLPKTFRELEKIFRDRAFWPKIQKRSKKLTDKLVKDYLEKLRKRFAVISPLLQSGDISPEDVKAKMMEAPEATKAMVETRFRTETTTYFAQAQVKFYEGDSNIIGFLFDSVTDSSRTDICRSRHGLVYRPNTKLLAENTPSLHWNCRSHLIPLAKTTRNITLLEDPARDPNKIAVAPLPPGWNLQGTEAKTRRRK